MSLGENILCNLMEQCFFSTKDKHKQTCNSKSCPKQGIGMTCFQIERCRRMWPVRVRYNPVHKTLKLSGTLTINR